METERNVTPGHTNPDAITGAPASHPGATGIGSASGAATGAAIGAIGGPIGAVIGGVTGAVVGAAIGHGAGEWNDPSDQTYWKENYKNRTYYDKDANYDRDYAPAYAYGGRTAAEHAAKSPGTASTFDKVENESRQSWDKVKGESKLTYDKARNAISDAYNRKVQQHQSNVQDSR